MTDIVIERFDSLYKLLSTVKSRPNNRTMEEEDSSQSNDYEFTRSHSYEEAENLAKYGYKDVLPTIREGMKSSSKKIAKKILQKQRCLPQNMVIGYTPNVPNTLLGRPDNMINVVRSPQKVKVIEIIYIMSGNCYEDKELWIKAGAIILEAIKFIEKANIRIKLSVCMFFAVAGEQIAISTVKIKDFGDKLDLQKVCFPIAHPSMFRRIGFKWIETNPDITDPSWSNGYGHSMSSRGENIIKYMNLPPNSYSISAQQIKEMNFDIIKVLKHFNCLKK